MDKTGIVLCTVMVFGVAATGCAKKTVAVTTPTAALPRDGVPGGFGRDYLSGVLAGRPAVPPLPVVAGPAELHFEDAFFNYDQSSLRPDSSLALANDSLVTKERLRSHPEGRFTIEGHCDERGSAEYNLAFGDQRARAAMEYLVAAGIRAELLTVVSYGKDKPVCEEHTEDCWQRNRRVHIVESGARR
jgi:peptidoglycan-associated lipoprotein